jgi:hypothetical protein
LTFFVAKFQRSSSNGLEMYIEVVQTVKLIELTLSESFPLSIEMALGIVSLRVNLFIILSNAAGIFLPPNPPLSERMNERT